METINNVAAAAAKVVWGENQSQQSGEEPRSGETGNTSKGEPYDAGNLGMWANPATSTVKTSQIVCHA